MPVTATTRYYAWVSRKGRHHGGSFAELITPESVSNYVGGSSETFSAGFAPAELPLPGVTPVTNVKFAFWSVAGGANGGLVGAPGQTHAPVVNVGSTNIVATAWYLPEGGGGNGGPGVWIDAFDVSIGDFVDDDFVSVTSTPALTAVANSDGWVPSDNAQTVQAFNQIHLVPFMQWNVVDGVETVTGTQLSVAPQLNATAFAFYNPTSSPTFTVPDVSSASAWKILFGIINDGPGIEVGPGGVHPVGPWGPEMLRILTQAVGIAVSTKMNREVKAKAVAQLNAEVKNLSAKINAKSV